MAPFGHQSVLHHRYVGLKRFTVAVTYPQGTVREDLSGFAYLDMTASKQCEKSGLEAFSAGKGRRFEEQRRFSGRQELGRHCCNLH
jgi:hypothetical protein